MMEKIIEAIPLVPTVDPYQLHDEVKNMYNWNDVAIRTEKVYDRVTSMEPVPLIDRMKKFYGCGVWAGKLFCMLVAFNYLVWCILEYFSPKRKIELAIDFPIERRDNHKYELN